MTTNTQPTTPPVDKPSKYLDLSQFTVPVLDFSIGKFGGIALMDSNERHGPIVAKLPPGRQIGKQHVDHIVSVWRDRRDLAPLNVYQTAHEIEVVEGTLHQPPEPRLRDTVIIQDMDPDKLFSGQQVRDMVERLPVERTGTAELEWAGKQAELLDQVDTIIANQCGIDDHNMICPHWKLREDLGADSLDKVEIMWAIEKLQQGELPDATYDQWQTVQDIHNTVTRFQQWAENNDQPLDDGPDTEDGEWAYGWALRCGKGPACYKCKGEGRLLSVHTPGGFIGCPTCHGSGVVGYKRKPLEQ